MAQMLSAASFHTMCSKHSVARRLPTVKLAYITPHQDRRHNKPHTCMQEYKTQCPITMCGNGQYSNSRYRSVPEAKTC